jgi:hypothetical protein
MNDGTKSYDDTTLYMRECMYRLATVITARALYPVTTDLDDVLKARIECLKAGLSDKQIDDYLDDQGCAPNEPDVVDEED